MDGFGRRTITILKMWTEVDGWTDGRKSVRGGLLQIIITNRSTILLVSMSCKAFNFYHWSNKVIPLEELLTGQQLKFIQGPFFSLTREFSIVNSRYLETFERSGQTNGQKNEWPIFMANGHLAIHHYQDSISGEWPWPFTWNRIWFWRMASHYKIRIFWYKEI